MKTTYDPDLVFDEDNNDKSATFHSANDLDVGAAAFFEAVHGEAVVRVTCDSSTGGTLDIELHDSADGSSFANVLALAQISLAAGVKYDRRVPIPSNARQHLRLRYVMGGTARIDVPDAYLTLN